MTTVSKDANVDDVKDCVRVIILEVYQDLSLAARLQRVIIDCGFRLVTHQFGDSTLCGFRGVHSVFHHEERGMPLAPLVERIQTVVGSPSKDKLNPDYTVAIGTDWTVCSERKFLTDTVYTRCTFAFA